MYLPVKTGIILVFHNYEKEMDINLFLNCCNNAKSIQFCLVNNDSKDNTYSMLKAVKESCENVSIVNIKKFKSDISAVKAGARYMYNNFKLNHIGYVNLNLINRRYQSLDNVIYKIVEHQDSIIKYDQAILKSHPMKRTLFQKLFSVVDYLKRIEIEREMHQIQYQNENLKKLLK